MPQGKLTIETALDQLREFSKLTHHRGSLRKSQAKRAREAFKLLAAGRPSNLTDAKQNYLEFLQRTNKVAGDVGIMLCAAGLGSAAIVNARESIRVYLPHRLKEILETTETSVLKDIAKSYAKDSITPQAPAAQENRLLGSSEDPSPTTSFTGDVYELTAEDVQMIAARPDQFFGKIRLTETYNPYAPSFITIPVSNELVNQFIIGRPKVI
ncbi:hypothetical protein ACJ73_02611 [Blastomyces percursus]|uniref:Uncharacterized protein n=1 Tax=Blastomyces percursus TaxID=1658174 RepID=A0A1J9RDD7_9EURO|nr:hypothetical protein ACJ73_02611 [Blastomyces percursus]